MNSIHAKTAGYRLKRVAHLFLLLGFTSCLADWDEPNDFIAGASVSTLRYENVELHPMVDMSHLFYNLFLKRAKEKYWWTANCHPGTSFYYYEYNIEGIRTDGYCCIRDGNVTASCRLSECHLEDAAVSTNPTNLLIDVRADRTQPVGFPVIVTLTLTDTTKTPFTYWCGGPGLYPNANRFSATVTDSEKQSRIVQLSNGQNNMGSGNNHVIFPGQTVTISASLGLLPAGTYSIKVSDGLAADVTVEANTTLAEKRSKELTTGIQEGNLFLQFVALNYNIKSVIDSFGDADILSGVRRGDPFLSEMTFKYNIDPVVDAIDADLISPDEGLVSQAAATLAFYGQHSESLVPLISKAMEFQLNPPAIYSLAPNNIVGSFVNTRYWVLMHLATIAGKIGSEEAMIPVLNLLHSKTSGLTGESREEIVSDLAEFKQERATKELIGLLNDSDPTIQQIAAQALAKRKEAAAIQPLIIQAFSTTGADPPGSLRPDAFKALLNFPRDPRVEATFKRGMESSDSGIHGRAEMALDQLTFNRQLGLAESSEP